MDRNRLYADLVRDEGERLDAYRDSKGLWTIGIGHLLHADPHVVVPRITKITKEESRALFDYDVAWAIALAQELFPQWSDIGGSGWFDDVRHRALVNMCFNRGETNMRQSKSITPAILAAVREYNRSDLAPGLWSHVGDVIVESPWAKQIGHRAERLAYMLETGKDPQ